MENRILIIAAMQDVELNNIINKLNNLKKTKYKGFNFFEGEIFEKKIVICESKIGLINAAIAGTIAIEKYKPKIIINEGLAGGYSEEIKRGEIVIGEEAINITSLEYKGKGDTLEDYEITTFLHNEENKLISQKADINIIKKIKKYTKKYNIHYGIIGSGDIWNKNKKRIKYLNKKYKILCEDMESIAIYTLANTYNIPVVAIKAISNNEILNENYDVEISYKLQQIIEEIIKII